MWMFYEIWKFGKVVRHLYRELPGRFWDGPKCEYFYTPGKNEKNVSGCANKIARRFSVNGLVGGYG